MRPLISQLERWNLAGLAEAAATARRNADTLLDSINDCSRAVDVANGWHGRTRDAVFGRTNEETDHGNEIRNLLLRFADDAQDAHDGFDHARRYVVDQKNLAVGQGFRVEDDGRVSHTDPEKAGAAGVFQLNLFNGLDEIERIDRVYGTSLRDIRAELAASRDGQPDVTLPGGERRDPDAVVAQLESMSPDERAALLATMSAADVQRLVIANPEKMGNLNGVPFETRIAANEINIANALAVEERKPNPDKSRVDRLRSMLGQIPDPATTDRPDQQTAATGVAAAPGNNLIDRKFVMFSSEGNGRMIEMVGDMKPGVSGVGVYVPGTSTNLNGSGTNSTAAWNLSDQTGGPIFLYMDGDFPQDMVKIDGLSVDGAPNPKFAQDMAPRLVDFGHEVDREVARQAPGTPVSYVGHSYGGSILGTAEQLGLRGDRILHASSAGTGVYSAPWDNPNPNVQRYSMTAPGDLIGIVQTLPHELNIQGIPLPGNPHAGNPLGGDPDEIPGVTRLDTGFYGTATGDHDSGEVVFGTDGHGKYWDDPKSTAFQNIVGVIAGTQVTEYVERGIETRWVDVGLGDDGDGAKMAFDAAKAAAAQKVGGWLHGDIDPYDNPRVTDNPQLGRSLEVP